MSAEMPTREDLRTLFLFESLDEEQLDWIMEHAEVKEYDEGDTVASEGKTGDWFYVLLSGTLRMCRKVRGEEVEVNRTDQRGVYFGTTQIFLDEEVHRIGASVYALTPMTVLALPDAEFSHQFREWFPLATHLLQGMWLSVRNNDATVGQRERLLALGSLSAGLTHELNNPAAAAVRATAQLRERVAGMRQKLAMLAKHDINPDLLEQLIEIQERLVKKVASAPKLTAMQESEREDEMSDWMDDHDVQNGFNLAPTFVEAGLTADDLADVHESVGDDFLDGALRWIAYAVETESLMGEIEDSTTRISTLIGAAKQYSQMDRAPHQVIDVHDGLKATLVMLGGKFGSGIQVVKEFDRSLPQIPAYAGELNQVWTNLIDNAVQAMDGQGTLTIRTRMSEDDRVVVEICDTGKGIPPENKQRIFEPFFTTKPVGEGTGLGLDISYRIVVSRHGGDMRVESEPGDTRFQVLLPLHEQPQAEG
ncbi:ATP-binding protein [Tenggerimyces flavus]|uniref:histidine kinase n=2 Tax=Tenggerimyces flavus TaxID=1708749 RepID=A0ABV7YFM5_9ACTN